MFTVGLDLATISGVAIGNSRVNHPSQVDRMSRPSALIQS